MSSSTAYTAPSPTTGPTPPMARDLNGSTIIIIAAVGFVILCAIPTLAWLLVRERRNHRRVMNDLERRGIDVEHQRLRQEVRLVHDDAIDRPRNVLRRSTFLPFGARTGWDTLASKEDVTREQARHVVPARNFTRRCAQEKRRSSIRISWPFTRELPVVAKAVPLQQVDTNGRLSAIVESPLMAHTISVSTVRDDSEPVPLELPNVDATVAGVEYNVGNKTIRRVDSAQPLRPEPLAVMKKRNRAQTMNATTTTLAPQSESKVNKGQHPAMHVRSFSLGSQDPGAAPQNPAPPLPLALREVDGIDRPRSCVENNASWRHSVSSVESINSSVLASPKLQRSTSEASARMHTGARRNYVNSLITGPRPLHPKASTKRPQSSPGHVLTLRSLKGSIRSNPDSEGDDGRVSRPSSGILAGSGMTDTLLSQSSVATAEAVRIRRVSAMSSNSPGGLNIITPRRQSRFMVTPNGSPSHRARSIALKEISEDQRMSRQLSQTSTGADSTRSSNGNPFQFDPSPMASGKPSAMKGSPSSRNKGHKRQNCVRISLSPTIINAQKRGSSPLMADIQEESPDNSAKIRQHATFNSSMGALPQPPSSPRPPSSATFAPELKLHPTSLRASLTPSSPTLSSMRFSHDFSSQDNNDVSLTSLTQGKASKRHSASSVGTIPMFPSPGKTSTMATNIQPTPIFSFTRPSNEIDRDSSPPESFKLLAQPFLPRLNHGRAEPAKSGAGMQLLSSPQAQPKQFIFPRLEKERLRASEPAFESLPSPDSTSSPSFIPHDWSSPCVSKESLPPYSPPCSPKTTSAYPMVQEPYLSSSPPLPIEALGLTLPLHSPSPIPGLDTYNSSLLSPSNNVEPPDSDLCLSITQLRRMNSDANCDAKNAGSKAARRYQRLGTREESPLFDQAVVEAESTLESRDSMGSLWEIDRALDDGLGVDLLRDADGDAVQRNDRDVDLLWSDVIMYEKEKDDARSAKKAKSSVRDSGERFWSRSRSSSPLGSSSRNVSPLSHTTNSNINRNSGGVQSPLKNPPVHRRVSEMRASGILGKLPAALNGLGTPKVVVQPPSSDGGTPGSLYDENGFLKERSYN